MLHTLPFFPLFTVFSPSGTPLSHLCSSKHYPALSTQLKCLFLPRVFPDRAGSKSFFSLFHNAFACTPTATEMVSFPLISNYQPNRRCRTLQLLSIRLTDKNKLRGCSTKENVLSGLKLHTKR